MPNHDSDYGLVMPFVNVTSTGGDYDDQAYCAGWEMGNLDAQLQHARPSLLKLTIRTPNCRQADLIAMRHGYRCYAETDEYYPEWTHLTLTKNPATD